MKAFADNKLKMIQMAKFVLDKVENIVGKEENAVNKYFLLFPQCFQMPFSLGSLKVGIVWQRVKSIPENKTRLVEIEHICRQQFECVQDNEFSF